MEDSLNLPALPEGYDILKDQGSYMNPYQLRYFANQLLSWKSDLEIEIDKLIVELAESRINDGDEFDVAVAETQIRDQIRKRDRDRKLIQKINESLTLIVSREYGYCQITGEPIGLKRLIAKPTATMTIEMQIKHENMEKDEEIVDENKYIFEEESDQTE
jgi:DnaK suppressor protein